MISHAIMVVWTSGEVFRLQGGALKEKLRGKRGADSASHKWSHSGVYCSAFISTPSSKGDGPGNVDLGIGRHMVPPAATSRLYAFHSSMFARSARVPSWRRYRPPFCVAQGRDSTKKGDKSHIVAKKRDHQIVHAPHDNA